MRNRMYVGVLLFVGLMVAGTYATGGNGVAPQKQFAVVNFESATLVGHQVLIGRYLVVHDDARMAQGLPCTTFYRLDPKTGAREEVVSFMCVRSIRPVVQQTTLAVRRSPSLDLATLAGYQFAGDTELHGVPQNLK